MSDPLEVEVVEIDGAPPPPAAPPRPEPGDWFRFDRRFVPRSRGSSIFSWLLWGLLAVVFLVFGLLVLTAAVAIKLVRGLLRLFLPGTGHSSSLGPSR